MNTLRRLQFAAFANELEKIGAIQPALGAALTFGGLGSLARGYQQYSSAREQGAGVGASLGAGARGAAQGAVVGAAAGAGLGAVAPGAAGAVSRFGQRQVHSLTGWTPREGLSSIRAGAHDATEALHNAQIAKHDLGHFDHALAGRPHALSEESLAGFKSMAPEQLAAHRAQVAKDLPKAELAAQAAQRAENMGLTSIPGVLKSVKNHGLIPTLHAGAAEQWHSGSTFDKALSFGLPAVGLARAATGKAEAEPGVGRGEQVGKEVGELVGGLAGTPLPFVGQMALQQGAGRLGRGVGRVVDRIRGSVPQEQPQ